MGMVRICHCLDRSIGLGLCGSGLVVRGVSMFVGMGMSMRMSVRMAMAVRVCEEEEA